MEISWEMLLGPAGYSVGATVVVVAVTRAALALYREVQTERSGRLEDRERYLEVVESQREFHVEQTRVLTRAVVTLERVEGHLAKAQYKEAG